MRVAATGKLTKSTSEAAAYDLTASEGAVLRPHVPVAVPVGVRTKMEGCYGLILSRSGLALQGVSVRGGLIDPDYADDWKVILVNDGDTMKCIEAGQRIAQVVFLPLPVVEVVGDGVAVSEVVRTGGFGSSGQ